MPKKHRKIHVGSRLWAAQKWRDIQAHRNRPRPEPSAGDKPKAEPKPSYRAPPGGGSSSNGGCGDGGGGSSSGSHENVHRVRHDPVRGAWLACLGLTARNDTPADITRAYRSLARVLHPDKCTAPDATRRFQALHAAYASLLSSP
jgi:hypothetical protein